MAVADAPEPQAADAKAALAEAQRIVEYGGRLDIAVLRGLSQTLQDLADADTDLATEALLVSAEVDLVAVATAVAAKRAAGNTKRINPERILRTLVLRLDKLSDLSPEQTRRADRLMEASATLIGVTPGVRDVRLQHDLALKLAKDKDLAGLAVRVVWLTRVREALEAWSDSPSELAVDLAVPRAGRLLCPRCADAHHVTPDHLLEVLLSKGNAGGLVCEAARLAYGEGQQPAHSLMGALALCPEIWPEGEPADPALLWGANPLVLGLLQVAYELVSAESDQTALGQLVSASAATLAERLERPVILPTPLVATSTGADRADIMAFGKGIGGGSSTATVSALGVMSVVPSGLRIGLRPIVSIHNGLLRSESLSAFLPAGGRAFLPAKDLWGAKALKSDRVVDAIRSALGEVRLAEQRLGPELGRDTPSEVGFDLSIDARLSSPEVERVLDGLVRAGVNSLRLLKTETHGRFLPLIFRDEPQDLETVLSPTIAVPHTTPIRVVVGPQHTDIWAAEGPKAPYPATGNAPKAPKLARQGLRNDRLVRLRVEYSGRGRALSNKDLQTIDHAIAFFQRRDGSGPFAHFLARDDTWAIDVLRVVRVFQERKGKALEAQNLFWPQTQCGSKVYRENQRTPSGCATGVAIAFSRLPIPSTRNLTVP